jgi:hypothetical protein
MKNPNGINFQPMQIPSIPYTRFVITDTRKDYKSTRYWTGKGKRKWTNNIRKALKCARWDQIGEVIKNINKYEYRHLNEQTFTIPINITLMSNGNVDLSQLRSYLERALTIDLNTQEHGAGPAPGAVVLVELDSNELSRETTPPDRDRVVLLDEKPSN